MNGKIVKTLTSSGALMYVLLGAAWLAQAQDTKTLYPAMAPIDQYLIADRNTEIALAKSAAPAAISDNATVLVLGKDSYQTAVEGKNGFTCLVERGWMSPLESPEFWDPKLRGPVCYNPAAVRSILPYTIKRTGLILAGASKAQMTDQIKAALASNELKMPETGAMSYMMSKGAYFGDGAGHWHPHLMFHIPTADGASWGADLLNSPVLLNDEFPAGPEPETVFMVTVDHWSDGTPFSSDPSAPHQH